MTNKNLGLTDYVAGVRRDSAGNTEYNIEGARFPRVSRGSRMFLYLNRSSVSIYEVIVAI